MALGKHQSKELAHFFGRQMTFLNSHCEGSVPHTVINGTQHCPGHYWACTSLLGHLSSVPLLVATGALTLRLPKITSPRSIFAVSSKLTRLETQNPVTCDAPSVLCVISTRSHQRFKIVSTFTPSCGDSALTKLPLTFNIFRINDWNNQWILWSAETFSCFRQNVEDVWSSRFDGSDALVRGRPDRPLGRAAERGDDVVGAIQDMVSHGDIFSTAQVFQTGSPDPVGTGISICIRSMQASLISCESFSST